MLPKEEEFVFFQRRKTKRRHKKNSSIYQHIELFEIYGYQPKIAMDSVKQTNRKTIIQRDEKNDENHLTYIKK
jgi:hypothetical protein